MLHGPLFLHCFSALVIGWRLYGWRQDNTLIKWTFCFSQHGQTNELYTWAVSQEMSQTSCDIFLTYFLTSLLPYFLTLLLCSK